MVNITNKLEKVEYINNKNLEMIHKRFTGKHTIHWLQGEPMTEEVNQKTDIKLKYSKK